MSVPPEFSMSGGIAYFRPMGNFTAPDLLSEIGTAVRYARENKIQELVINIKLATIDWIPSITERYNLASLIAGEAKSAIKIAMVVPEALIDPNRFGVTVARNRGLNGEVFSTEQEAIAWLMVTNLG